VRGMTAADYAEHGAASLRYGFDDGPMYVIEVDRLGRVRFEEWADQDYENELTETHSSRACASSSRSRYQCRTATSLCSPPPRRRRCASNADGRSPTPSRTTKRMTA